VTARVVVLSAPSGGGKTTIARALVSRRRDVACSISATTRPPRPGERDGVAYFFISRAEFQRRVHASEFLEWAEYAGELYGTLKREVDGILAAGRHALLAIEVEGARQVRRAYPPPASVSVFILPPSSTSLLERLASRKSERGAVLARRLERAVDELHAAPDYDAIVVNDALDRAVLEIEHLIDSAAPPRMGPPAAEPPMDVLIRDLAAEAARLRRQPEETA
jgi:guanylate kinase